MMEKNDEEKNWRRSVVSNRCVYNNNGKQKECISCYKTTILFFSIWSRDCEHKHIGAQERRKISYDSASSRFDSSCFGHSQYTVDFFFPLEFVHIHDISWHTVRHPQRVKEVPTSDRVYICFSNKIQIKREKSTQRIQPQHNIYTIYWWLKNLESKQMQRATTKKFNGTLSAWFSFSSLCFCFELSIESPLCPYQFFFWRRKTKKIKPLKIVSRWTVKIAIRLPRKRASDSVAQSNIRFVFFQFYFCFFLYFFSFRLQWTCSRANANKSCVWLFDSNIVESVYFRF